jgi:tetratricopeptide (TPR) repeat protein
VANKQQTKLNTRKPRSFARASGIVVLAASISIVSAAGSANAQSDRFAHAQKTIVPASKFSRRYDDESVSDPVSTHAPATSSGSPSRTSKAQGSTAGHAQQGTYDSSPITHVADKDYSVLATARAKVQPMIAIGKYDSAQTTMQTYVNTYPADKSLKEELAKVAVRNSEHKLQIAQPKAAASCAREALIADPGSQPAREALSIALQKMNVDPSNGSARAKLADGLLAQGKPAEAAVEYSESLRLKPSAEAHTGLGDAQWRLGRKQQAQAEYQHALEVNPRSSVALRQLGTLRLKEGDIVGANSDLSKALVINPTDKATSGQLIELWRAQVVRVPGSANSHLGLARAYQLSGELALAQSEYREVVKIDPTNPKLPQARASFKAALARQQAKGGLQPPTSEPVALVGTAGSLAPTGTVADAAPPLAPPMVPLPGSSSAYGAIPGSAMQQSAFGASSGLAAPQSAMMAAPAPVTATGAPPAGSIAASSPTGLQQQVPVMTAAPGSIMAPSTQGDPDTQPGKYSTTAHVNTLGSFLGQLQGLAVAGQQAQQASSISAAGGGLAGATSVLGGLGGMLGGGSATGAPVAAGIAGGASPVLDTSSAQGALAQAAAALRAAGVAPTASATATNAAAATAPPTYAASPTYAAPPTYGAPSGYASPPTYASPTYPAQNFAAVSGTGAPAYAGSNQPYLANVAAQAFPQIAGQMDPAVLARLVQQYGPMLQAATAGMTPAQMQSMYSRYRGSLEAQFNTKLPEQLPPELRNAVLSATTAPPPVAPFIGAGANPYAPTLAPPLSIAQAAAPPDVTPNAVPTTQTASAKKAKAKGAHGATTSSSVAARHHSTVSSASAPLIMYTPGTSVAPVVPVAPATSNGSLPPDSALRGPLLKPGQNAPLPLSINGASGATGSATAPNSSDGLRGFLPPCSLKSTSSAFGQPLKLELLGVQPNTAAAEVQLQVRLRNMQAQPFKIPEGMKAVVSMNGKKRTGKVFFPNDVVPPNGELVGTIKVAGPNLNPSSELWIPNVLPGSGADRDLHLSVNVPMTAPL